MPRECAANIIFPLANAESGIEFPSSFKLETIIKVGA
jgi:hypothetical protein